ILTDSEAEAESNARYAQALALLTEVQRSRFLMYAAGLSTHEIARREGTNQKSVHESIEAARKKLKKFYADTPSN
ncbi:MAG: sigma factor-like helix-turn-helix DNA-binding protein, partial [Aristaeellaceae bacterium]